LRIQIADTAILFMMQHMEEKAENSTPFGVNDATYTQ
jgi:hypothetical protein